MVHEVRRIMLTPDELLAAYEIHRRATPEFMPTDSRVVSCLPTEDGSVRVTVQMPEGHSPSKMDFVLKGFEAVKPLIRFCLENNIMLPRHGQKTIFVKDGVASLYVVLNLAINVTPYLPASRLESGAFFTPGDIKKEMATVQD